MIENFTDHAANERTYLSWVRTALSVIAFAVIIEKFSLLIHAANPKIVQDGTHKILDQEVNIITVILILTGLLTMIGATIRFMVTRRHIDAIDRTKKPPYLINLMLGLLLIFITASGLFYSLHILNKFF